MFEISEGFGLKVSIMTWSISMSFGLIVAPVEPARDEHACCFVAKIDWLGPMIEDRISVLYW